jgi:hypothetical protein
VSDFRVCPIQKEALFYMRWEKSVPQRFADKSESCLCLVDILDTVCPQRGMDLSVEAAPSLEVWGVALYQQFEEGFV